MHKIEREFLHSYGHNNFVHLFLFKINKRLFLFIYALGAMRLHSKSRYAFFGSPSTDPNSAGLCMCLLEFVAKSENHVRNSPGTVG